MTRKDNRKSKRSARSQPCVETKWRRVRGMPGVTKRPSTGSTTGVDFEDHSHKGITDAIVQLFKGPPSVLVASCRKFTQDRVNVFEYKLCSLSEKNYVKQQSRSRHRSTAHVESS